LAAFDKFKTDKSTAYTLDKVKTELSIFWLKDKAARDKAICDPIITLEVVLYDYGA